MIRKCYPDNLIIVILELIGARFIIYLMMDYLQTPHNIPNNFSRKKKYPLSQTMKSENKVE